MRAFLVGQIPIDTVESQLGPSSSGSRRFAFYRTLVRNDHHGFMEKLYGFTQDVLQDHFSGCVSRYLTAHPPDHWEPNQTGARFPEWLRHDSEAILIAPWIGDLAQYEWFEFVVYTDPTPDNPVESGLSLNSTMRALKFEFDVPGWITSGRPLAEPNPGPARRDLILLMYRDSRTLQCKFLEATPWTQLIVTSLENGDDPLRVATAAGADAETATQAILELTRVGLLHNTSS